MLLVYLGCSAPPRASGLRGNTFTWSACRCTDVTHRWGKIPIGSLGAPKSAEADRRFRDVPFCLPTGSGAIKFGCVGASMRRNSFQRPGNPGISVKRKGEGMRFGFFDQLPCADGFSEHQRYKDILAQIDLGDALGFDTVWLGEIHFIRPFSILADPLMALAAAAQREEQDRLGNAETSLQL